MNDLDTYFREIGAQLVAMSREKQTIDEDRIFQPANYSSRPLVDKLVGRVVLPGSAIDGFENLQHLAGLSKNGASCLLLCEHYSNFDIPCLFYLAREYSDGAAITDSIVAMAGAKLNEESRFILAFTEAYSRIIIYPARALQALEGTEAYEEERTRSRWLNRRALREMIRVKHSGHIVLLFPAGTRYRASKPESRNILLEVDSYIRGFKHICFVGIAGNTLVVNEEGIMDQDQRKEDVVAYKVSEVTSADAFRTAARANEPDGGEAAKRAVARAVQDRFAELHSEAEAVRAKALAART